MSKTCEELLDTMYERTMADLRGFMVNDDYVGLNEYGLCLDYVEPGTWEDQPHGFVRWQIAWGGPQEEIRWYQHEPDNPQYYYMDWFDGANRPIDDLDQDVVMWIEGFFEVKTLLSENS